MKPFTSLVRIGSLLAALAAAVPALRADSLWVNPSRGERSMYADRKAGAVGDIVTIAVNETVSADNTSRTKSDRSAAANSAITQFLFPTSSSAMGTHNGALPGTSFNSSNNFTGGGEVSSNQTLTASTAVLVTDVLPNGNLVIQGVRVVAFSGERQYVVLHGVIRPDDISPTNTIASSSIADARVEFISEGALTDAQKKGWFTKLYDFLKPY